MHVLLIALTALYSLEANVMGNSGLIGYLIAFLGTMLVQVTGGTRRSLFQSSWNGLRSSWTSQ
jgi:hypothetical protein